MHTTLPYHPNSTPQGIPALRFAAPAERNESHSRYGRRCLALVLVLLCAGVLAGCQSASPTDPALAVTPEGADPGRPFFDNFAADEINAAVWEVGTWSEHGGQTGVERTYLEDGKLNLVFVNDSEEGYLNAAIQTRETFLYGRWEARLKPSDVPGVLNSMYTIDWNGGDGTRQEIDIEFLTYTFEEDRGEVHLAVHAAERDSWGVDVELDFNPSDRFRVWGFEITPEHIEWFVDGQTLYRYHYDEMPVTIDTPYQLKFNVWTQRNWIQGPPEPDVESIYQIDWIRFTPTPQDAPAVKALSYRHSVSQYGITWTFAEPAPVGRFVNGDWYVVGPVTVTAIDPEPRPGRHGSALNLPLSGRAPYDSRMRGERYDPDLAAELPIELLPGDSLISTISLADDAKPPPRMLRPEDQSVSFTLTAAVLTCLDAPAPADAFRPAYTDSNNRIYRASQLRRELLPRLPRVEDTPPLADWERVFQRPWLDTVGYSFGAPVDNMPQYGREFARATGMAALLLALDFEPAEKEALLIHYVQLGIDLWGMARAGNVFGWRAHGGHGNGRKLPIILAGTLLGDEEMQNPVATYPDLRFSEDMQTMYDEGWTGATAVYGGHVGPEGDPESGWGRYEHLHPRDWPARIGESYRRCCTSIAWVGTALAARIYGLTKPWNHDAFFDYADRWMSEDDTEHVRIIQEERGWDFSASWARQGQTWDELFNQMWARYRADD